MVGSQETDSQKPIIGMAAETKQDTKDSPSKNDALKIADADSVAPGDNCRELASPLSSPAESKLEDSEISKLEAEISKLKIESSLRDRGIINGSLPKEDCRETVKDESEDDEDNGLVARAPDGIPTRTTYDNHWYITTPDNDYNYTDGVAHKYRRPNRQPVENDENEVPIVQQIHSSANDTSVALDDSGWINFSEISAMPPQPLPAMSAVSHPIMFGYGPSSHSTPYFVPNSPMSMGSGSSPAYTDQSMYHDLAISAVSKSRKRCGSEQSMQGSPASSYSPSSPANSASSHTILPDINSPVQPKLPIFDGSGEQLNSSESFSPASHIQVADSPGQKVPSPNSIGSSPAHPNSPDNYSDINHKSNFTGKSPQPYSTNQSNVIPIPCPVEAHTCSGEIPTSKPHEVIPTTVPGSTISQQPLQHSMTNDDNLELANQVIKALEAEEEEEKIVKMMKHHQHQQQQLLQQQQQQQQQHHHHQQQQWHHHHLPQQQQGPPLLLGYQSCAPGITSTNPSNVYVPGQVKRPQPSVRPQMSGCEANKRVAMISSEKLMYKDKDGDSVLMMFVVKEVPSTLIHALLERYKREDKLYQIINDCNKLQQTPVYMASVLNQPEVVRLLLKFGADVNLQAHMNEQYARSPLHCVASKGDNFLPTLQALLSSPLANVNQRNFDGLTPLHCAIKAHASLPPNRSGEMIFSTAIMEELVRHPDTDIDMGDGKSGKTPVHYVVESKNPRLVQHLFSLISKHRRNKPLAQYVNSVSFDGNTSLHIAVGLHMPEAVEEHKMLVSLLMRSGADPTIKNSSQKMPKELAKIPEIIAIVKGTTASVRK